MMEIAGIGGELMSTLTTSLEILGHMIREDGLEKHVLSGRAEGRGRQRAKYMDVLLQGVPRVTRVGELIRMAEARQS